MKVKTTTFCSVLMELAHEESQAKLSGDKKEFKRAKKAHDYYRKLCLNSDKMIMDI